jgi:hypothetical protein
MTNKIIRTPTTAKGGITEQERAEMTKLNDKFIANAFRTDSVNYDEINDAITRLYAAANLKAPRVVVVPSPIVMAYAYGASAAIWYNRKNKGVAVDDTIYEDTREATNDVISKATSDATRKATFKATFKVTYDAVYNAIDMTTSIATRKATDYVVDTVTDIATYDAVYNAIDMTTSIATRKAVDVDTYMTNYAINKAVYDDTYIATDVVTYEATRKAVVDVAIDGLQACKELAGDFGVSCAKEWWKVYQGGAYWAGSLSRLAAMRDILKLELPEFGKYQAWEDAAMAAPFRVMHEEFCIVSDFPCELHMDENNQPHCETGPSHLWRDGFAIYHWHGVEVPAHWIEDKEDLDPVEVIKCENVEQRAAGAAIIGWPKMLNHLDCKVIDDSGNKDMGRLIELTLPGLPRPGRFLHAFCPRNGDIVEGVPYVSDIDNLPIDTVIAAQAWRIGDPQSEYEHPTKRT